MALGSRNPSPAITASSFLLPFLTFFAITSFLLRDQELTVFMTVSISYAFATAAMMVPALSEFDFALAERKRSTKNKNWLSVGNTLNEPKENGCNMHCSHIGDFGRLIQKIGRRDYLSADLAYCSKA